MGIVTQVAPNQLPVGQSNAYGPLDVLAGNGFNYDIYQYPTIQNPDFPSYAHNIIFYINIPQESAWNTGPQNGPPPVQNRGNVNATEFGLRTPQQVTASQDGSITQKAQNITSTILSSKTVRTTAAISLYIPNNMVFSHNLQWENVSLTKAAGIIGDATSFASQLKNGIGAGAGAALSSIIPDLSSRLPSFLHLGSLDLGLGLDELVLGYTGLADNPQNFLLFKQIDFRKFQFDFILVPETPQEASVIQEIIYLFRFNSVPEVLTGSLGRFFIPPSEFDIQFSHNGQENQNIPLISTCVLNSVSVNYAAGGQWTTTYDGFPQMISMSLSFTEKTILTKDQVQSGF